MSSAFQNSLLVILNDMMGRDVDVTLKDGVKYTGILAACSPELSVGLHLAFKLTERNRGNLLPYKDDVVDKIIFNFQDVVEVSAPVSEPKTGIQAMNFATDRDYHARNGGPSNQEERLEEWTGEDDEGLESNDEPDANRNHELPDQRNRNAAGWSVEEMFAANKEKVVSTFKDDLTQYTTVAVEGTEEDRARADRLAREIEQNTSSKFYARLENDDIERDLDKETGEDDFELVGNRRGKGYKQNQGSSRQSSNGVNMNNSLNRRADALKGSDRRNSGGSSQQQQQQRYSAGPQGAQYSQQNQGKQQYNNGRSNKNEESFDNKGKGNYPPKQMLESRSNTINKPSEEERRAGKNSIISSLKSFGNEFELKDSSSSSASNAAGAWNSGPPKSLLSKNGGAENSSVVQSPPSTSNESNSAEQQQHQRSRRESGEASTSEDSAQKSKGQQQQQNNQQQLNDSGEHSSSNESNTMTPSTADNSDASSNAGVPKSSSSSTFKFNINAPEFVPTVKPTTPQPGTPTNQFPPHFQQAQQQPLQIAPQQFVQQQQQAQQQQPHDYQQQQAQGAHMMQGQPIVGGPHMAANGQPVMVWQQPQQAQQYPGQYQYVQIQHPMQRGPAQGAMYNGGNQQRGGGGGPQQPQQAQQAQQQRMFVQQWQQPVIVPQPIGYFQPQQAAAAAAAAVQYNPQQAQQAQQQQPPHLINAPPPPQGYGPQQGGGRGGAYPQQQQQQQMYMMQQQQAQQGQQRYPQQGAPHDFNGAGAQGPQSHPNSQPTTPGPQQGAAVPSPGQSVTGGGLRQGPESGSQGSLAGSANGSHTRSGSPQPPATAPSSIPENRGGAPLMNMPPPPPQQLQYMHVAPPMHPQLHQGQQPYYPQHIYYPQGVMYQQHGMAMQQGPPGVGPHQAQMMGGPIDPQQPPQHMMDNQGMQAMQQQQQHPFVVDQYSAYQNGPTCYQPPHGAAMSRQNSVPHQYQGANQGGNGGARDSQQGAGGSQSGAPSQNS